jgi:hypothetical protein
LKKLKIQLDEMADHREKLPGDLPDDLGMTEQRMFDESDARVPKRYKITLKCRLPDDGSPRAIQLDHDDVAAIRAPVVQWATMELNQRWG